LFAPPARRRSRGACRCGRDKGGPGHHAVTRSALDAARRLADSGAQGRRRGCSQGFRTGHVGRNSFHASGRLGYVARVDGGSARGRRSMTRWSLGARVGSVFLIWCVLASLLGLWGFQVGTARGPIPGGCGCFNPVAILVRIGWGVFGAFAGVSIVSAAMALVGLVLYTRSMRRGARAEVAVDESVPGVMVDAWLSEVAEAEARDS